MFLPKKSRNRALLFRAIDLFVVLRFFDLPESEGVVLLAWIAPFPTSRLKMGDNLPSALDNLPGISCPEGSLYGNNKG